MKFFFTTLAVIAMCGFAIGTIVEIVVSIGRILTFHPFQAVWTLVGAAVFFLLAWGCLKVAQELMKEAKVE